MDLHRRALLAYLKSGGEWFNDHPVTFKDLTIDGLEYVVLSNCNRLLAVYRYISTQDVLKRLKRWPQEIEQGVEK